MLPRKQETKCTPPLAYIKGKSIISSMCWIQIILSSFNPTSRGKSLGYSTWTSTNHVSNLLWRKKKEAVLALLGDDPKAQEWSGEFQNFGFPSLNCSIPPNTSRNTWVQEAYEKSEGLETLEMNTLYHTASGSWFYANVGRFKHQIKDPTEGPAVKRVRKEKKEVEATATKEAGVAEASTFGVTA